MESLQESVQNVGSIVNVIKGIAELSESNLARSAHVPDFSRSLHEQSAVLQKMTARFSYRDSVSSGR